MKNTEINIYLNSKVFFLLVAGDYSNDLHNVGTVLISNLKVRMKLSEANQSLHPHYQHCFVLHKLFENSFTTIIALPVHTPEEPRLFNW